MAVFETGSSFAPTAVLSRTGSLGIQSCPLILGQLRPPISTGVTASIRRSISEMHRILVNFVDDSYHKTFRQLAAYTNKTCYHSLGNAGRPSIQPKGADLMILIVYAHAHA